MDVRVKAEAEGGGNEGDIDIQETLLTLRDLALLPYRLLVSKTAQRAYITTIIFAILGFFLAIVATIVYFFFYYSYIPDLSFTLPIYLDHSASSVDRNADSWPEQYTPWGRADIASVGANLLSNQAYDVIVELTLPRTANNIETGNFMVDVALTSRDFAGAKSTAGVEKEGEGSAEADGVIARSRRPTILTQRSSTVDYAGKLIALPWYVAGWKTEAESLEIKMLERVRFARGWRNVPKTVVLRLESIDRLQVYTARVRIEARLAGLRWMMYRHRIFSFVVLTTIFWGMEMVSALVLYVFCYYYFFSRPSSSSTSSRESLSSASRRQRGGLSAREFQQFGGRGALGSDENEEAEDFTDEFDLSDTPRTFPSFSRHPQLRYSSPPKEVKLEEDDDEDAEEEGQTAILGGRESIITAADADADDEDDEDADYVLEGPPGSGLAGSSSSSTAVGTGLHFSDSGIGTSMDSGGGAGGASDSIRRRKSSSKRER